MTNQANIDRAQVQLERAQYNIRQAQVLLEPSEPPPERPPPEEPPPERPPPDRPPPPPTERQIIAAAPGGGDALYRDGDIVLVNTLILAGYRAGIINSMGTKARSMVRLDSCRIASLDPNGPPNWDRMGTFWGSRMYGIGSCQVIDLTIRDLFGKYLGGPPEQKQTNEGHGIYWDLSPTPGAQYTFEGCTFENMGGHGLYLTTSWCGNAINTARCGHGPQPEDGAALAIRRCKFHNTDQSPARGAYALTLPDTFCETIIDQCEFIQDGPSFYKNGQPMGSRGLLTAEGHMMPSLTVQNSVFKARPPSDRTAQVWLEGPGEISLIGCVFDCQQVSINHPYADKPTTIKTKTLRISRCEGDADVLWNGELIGKASDLNDEWVMEA